MKFIIPITIIGCIGWLLACERPEVGYLSDHIFYNTNPFKVQKGVTTFSSPIVANGSTSPLNVELVKVTDADGQDITEQFTEPGSIVTFTGTITYQDSTLEMLQAKLQDSLVTPFSINEIGGRLQFSAATAYLAAGSYNIDVFVENSKDSYTIENACEIELIEIEDSYAMNYKRVTTSSGLYQTADSYISIDVKYVGGGDSSLCVYKFLDKNGTAFNPAKGEISRYATNYPFFDDWNPWYPVILTDTAFVQQMPNYQGLEFPYFNDFVAGGQSWSDVSARYDLKVPQGYIKELDEKLACMISFQYFATGTFIVTTQFNQFTKVE